MQSAVDTQPVANPPLVPPPNLFQGIGTVKLKDSLSNFRFNMRRRRYLFVEIYKAMHRAAQWGDVIKLKDL